MSEKTIVATLDKDDVVKMLVEAFRAGTTSYYELAEDFCNDLYETYVTKKIHETKKLLIEVPEKGTVQQNNLNFFRDLQTTVINSADFFQTPTLQVIGSDISVSSTPYSRITSSSPAISLGSTTLFDNAIDVSYNNNSNRNVQ